MLDTEEYSLKSTVLHLLSNYPLLTAAVKRRAYEVGDKMTSKAEDVLETTVPFCLPTPPPFLLSFPLSLRRWILSPLTGSGDRVFLEPWKNLY